MAEAKVAPDFIPDSQFTSDEDKYGGASGMAKAAGLGALRGTTLGLSDVALTKSGLVNPETIKGLEEENPVSSIAGEAASFLAPTGAAGLIGKAGKVVTGGVKALNVAKDAYEVSRAAKILGATTDIGAHALGSSVEGAIYAGVGNSLHEYALGDPSLNGEKIMANFGNGFLMGGAIGGAMKGAMVGLPPAVEAAKDALVKTRNVIAGTGEGTGGLIGKGLDALGKSEEAQAWSNRIKNLDVDQKIELANSAGKSLNETWKNVDTAIKTLNKDIRPEETQALIGSADVERVIGSQQDVVNKMNEVHEMMRAEPEVYSQNAARKLERLRIRIADQMKESVANKDPLAAFNILRDTKKELGEMVFTKVPTEQTRDTVEALKGVSGLVNDTLKNPEIFGDAGARLAEHDDVMSKMYKFISPSNKATDFQKAFGSFEGQGYTKRWAFDPKKIERVFKQSETIGGQQKMDMLDAFYDHLKVVPEHIESTYQNVPNQRFDKEALSNILENSQSSIQDAHEKYMEAIQGSKGALGLKDYTAGVIAHSHPIIGAAYAAYNIATKPIEYMAKLATVERTIGKTSKAIGDAAGRIFDPAMQKLYQAKNPLVRSSLDEHDYKKASENVKALAHNTDMLNERLTKQTEGFASAAPDTSTHTQMASTRAIQFLASKLPPDTSSPFEKEGPVSKAQIESFNRYKETVANPTGVLDHVANGTLGAHELETLQVVYPQLYDHMKTTVLNHAAQAMSKKQDVPYRTRQMLSMFLNQPLDRSLMGQSIAMNQAVMNRPQQPQQQGQKKVPTSAKLGMAERSGFGSHIDA